MDWNSDGEMDIVSGDRNGTFSVFIRHDSELTAYYQYKLTDSTVLDVGNNSQPAVVDWNGDGMKDLLLGEENGSVRFYQNLTSDSWPMFLGYTNVEAGGAPISIYRPNPYVFDLDMDGRQDLICGANDGYVRFFRNIGTNASPILAPEETLKTVAGVPIQPVAPNYYGSRCGFGDWNDDSLPDFLISGYEGMVELYRGAPFVGARESRVQPVAVSLSVTPTLGRARFRMASTRPGRVVIADGLGRTVAELGEVGPGRTLTWDGRDCRGEVRSGVYFCRLNTGTGVVTRRIVVSR